MFKRLTAMALFVVTVFTCSAGAAIRSDDYYRQQLGDEAYEQMMEDYQKDLEENGVYTDVPYDHWAFQAILDSATLGYMQGFDDGSFRPSGTLTRAQFASIMNRYCGGFSNYQETADNLGYNNLGKIFSGFADVSTDAWYYNDVMAINSLFTVDGIKVWTGSYWQETTGMNFRPNDPITRGEVAAVISKFADSYLSRWYNRHYNFDATSNLSDISDGSYEAFVSTSNIITGYADGTFKPNGTLTRAECATILMRLIDFESRVIEKYSK